MSQFVLKSRDTAGVTSISNLFLDHYMPRANGEYVKVYLYLLRALNRPELTLSVASLADALDRTESDILRALKYWEKQGLLTLECNASNVLLGIYLCSVPEPEKDHPSSGSDSSASKVPDQKSYSPDELQQFSQQSECRQLLFVCSQYLGKSLSPSEIETLLYFYDQLHFSSDLIEYLVEYCVCKGSKSIHYIRTVGLAWAESGISTVAQAKERTTTYRRNTFAIMKAFGINDRNPVESELVWIDKWLTKYDFTLDLVLEACSRTMERLHKPNFEYADRILSRWADQKVHNMADVAALDREHQKKNTRKTAAVQARTTGFTNFQQRDYDFDELEKQLLDSQKQGS